MYYIEFKNGEIVGRYTTDDHDDTIPAGSVEVSEELFWRTSRETDGVWKLVDGEVVKTPFPEPEPPTLEQIELQKLMLVQRHMDAAAQALRYDDIKTACTYADEPAVPKFQAEGQAFRAWRSLVWAKCYEILEAVHAGERDIPTDTELIAELPALQLPAA